MSLFALGLVLTASFIHASWNLLAKRASASGVGFVWLFTTASALLYAPVILVLALLGMHPGFNAAQIFFIAGNGLLNGIYFVLLQKGYQRGDFSVVYPLARGTGPLLSTLIAIIFLGERPSWLALTGAALILLGVVLISGNPLQIVKAHNRWAILYSLLTGLVIGLYTIWDKEALTRFHVGPLFLNYYGNLGRVILFTPFVLTRKAEIQTHWHNHKWEVLGVALLSPLSYFLVLVALSFAPVSYVAPARETSILIGAVLGAWIFKEPESNRRTAAACLMLLGIFALALG